MIKDKEKIIEFLNSKKEYIDKIKEIKIQFKFPNYDNLDECIYRSLEIDDISFITFEGWQGEKGVFIWYYPLGVPHYSKIDD